jgi:hypothetical protein
MSNQTPDPKPTDAEQPAGKGLDETACCASSIRDVRIHEQWENGFYGMFHGDSGDYQIAFERDHPGSQWAWIVREKSGAVVAAGYEPKGKTSHEVLHAAGCGANLWHNDKMEQPPLTKNDEN